MGYVPSREMITFDGVKQLIHDTGDDGPALRALDKALRSGLARPLGDAPGRGTARELLGTFVIRQRTANEAGLGIVGLDRALDALRQCGEQEQMALFHFVADDRFFSVFVRQRDERLLGCISGDRTEDVEVG